MKGKRDEGSCFHQAGMPEHTVLGRIGWSQCNVPQTSAAGRQHREAFMHTSRESPGARGCMQAHLNPAASLLSSEESSEA